MKLKIRPSQLTRVCLSVIAMVLCLSPLAYAQAPSSYERESGREMLKMIKLDIQKNYYDPTFHGLDLEARFKEADEKIKQATSNGHIFGIIAQTLIDFNDSHLFFLPPPRAASVEYGWQMQMIGDKCYVVSVKPGSDAEAKGVKPGDIILSMDGFEPTRENLWKMRYFYYTLRPKPGIRVVAQSPDGQPRQLDLMAKVRPGKKVIDFTQGNAQDIVFYLSEAESESRLHRHRFYEQDGVVIWKMPGFDIYDQDKVDEKIAQAKKGKALILDLRGNGGGYVAMLKRMLGYFFDHDVKIADVKYRKEVKQEFAKTRGGDVFKGKLVVLIDSGSGSAAEIFARVIQIEKRGIIIGDRSSGAVMQSLTYSHDVGIEIVAPYGVSVTNADLFLPDGKSLETVGVTPDELVLPIGDDLAARRDPVLARAASLVGLNLDPEKAGALFPIEWRK